MRPRVTVLATFDYELFLGADSGTPDACLLRPTELLLEALRRARLQAVFFVDTVYLLRLKEVSKSSTDAAKDYRAICRQITRMGEAGHDVFPHLHPHWLDAVYDPRANRWALREYRFYALDACEPGVREQLMGESVSLLEELLGENMKRPLGYRAGGWCIQPFSIFQPLFEKWGVAFDFSVVPGSFISGGVAAYNFGDAPSICPYRFSNDVCRINPMGRFVEFPISVVEMNHLDSIQHHLAFKFFWRLGSGKMMGNGKGAPIGKSEMVGRSAGVFVSEMASMDHFSAGKIPAYLRGAKRDGILHLCSHPKTLSTHGIRAFLNLVRILRLQASVDSDWRALLS